jgi:hypothetical protein
MVQYWPRPWGHLIDIDAFEKDTPETYCMKLQYPEFTCFTYNITCIRKHILVLFWETAMPKAKMFNMQHYLVTYAKLLLVMALVSNSFTTNKVDNKITLTVKALFFSNNNLTLSAFTLNIV